MPDFYYGLAKFALTCFGPLTLIAILLMYISVYRSTGKPPHVAGIVFTYVRLSTAKKGHPGVLTYLLIVCGFFFVVSMVGLFVMDVMKN